MYPRERYYDSTFNREEVFAIVDSSLEGTKFPFTHPDKEEEINGVIHFYLRQVAYHLFWLRNSSKFPQNLVSAKLLVDRNLTERRYKIETQQEVKVSHLTIVHDYLVDQGVMNRREAGTFIDVVFKTIYELVYWRVTTIEGLKQAKKRAKNAKAAEKRQRKKVGYNVGGDVASRTTKTYGGNEGEGGPPHQKWHKRRHTEG